MASACHSRSSATALDASSLRSPPMFSKRSPCLAIWSMLIGAVASGAAAADGASVLAAAKNGTPFELAELLAAGGDPNEADADGTSALHWAVHLGGGESVWALLAAGAAA